MVFRYLPPAPEEQRAFAAQFLGSMVGIVALGVAIYFVREAALRGILLGMMLGTIWLLARSAWQLEQKERRAKNTQLSLNTEELTLVNAAEYSGTVAWKNIETCEVRGGRLHLAWRDDSGSHSLDVGARELENGMEFVRQSTHFYDAAHGKISKIFIPLQAQEPPNFEPPKHQEHQDF